MLKVNCEVVSQLIWSMGPVLIWIAALRQVLNKLPLLHSVIDRAISAPELARSATARAPPRNRAPFPSTAAAPGALAADVVLPV